MTYRTTRIRSQPAYHMLLAHEQPAILVLPRGRLAQSNIPHQPLTYSSKSRDEDQ